jgi:hypothetical protein
MVNALSVLVSHLEATEPAVAARVTAGWTGARPPPAALASADLDRATLALWQAYISAGAAATLAAVHWELLCPRCVVRRRARGPGPRVLAMLTSLPMQLGGDGAGRRRGNRGTPCAVGTTCVRVCVCGGGWLWVVALEGLTCIGARCNTETRRHGHARWPALWRSWWPRTARRLRRPWRCRRRCPMHRCWPCSSQLPRAGMHYGARSVTVRGQCVH